ncbi:hypothetical protein [Hydrocoleum sp. CS-953]|nr:hypothetical protein [Hydrocoleum sp. CS-953]
MSLLKSGVKVVEGLADFVGNLGGMRVVKNSGRMIYGSGELVFGVLVN